MTPCLQSFSSRCPSTTCSQNSSFHIKWPWHPGENQLTVNIGVHFKTFNFTALIHMVLIMPNHSVLFIISFQIVKYDSYFFSSLCKYNPHLSMTLRGIILTYSHWLVFVFKVEQQMKYQLLREKPQKLRLNGCSGRKDSGPVQSCSGRILCKWNIK